MRGRQGMRTATAAVATVLLFGGVVHHWTMMVYDAGHQEMEAWWMPRHVAQMTLLAHETATLSERGMPGDSAHATLIPVDGELSGTAYEEACGTPPPGLKT